MSTKPDTKLTLDYKQFLQVQFGKFWKKTFGVL